MLPFSVLNEKQPVNSWLLAVYNLTAGHGRQQFALINCKPAQRLCVAKAAQPRADIDLSACASTLVPR